MPGGGSRGWVRGQALFELDADGVVAVLVDVLDGVRALGLHPAHSWTGRSGWASLGLELQGAARVVPDPGRAVDDHDARRLVGVLRLAGSWLDHHVQYPDLAGFQENMV